MEGKRLPMNNNDILDASVMRKNKERANEKDIRLQAVTNR